MDFLINNIGWFFGIAIVSVLAFIGYKADNKEKQQNNNTNKYIPKEIPKYEETTMENKPEEYKNNTEEKITKDIPDMYQNKEENNDMEDLYAPLIPSQPKNYESEPQKTINEENPIEEQENNEQIAFQDNNKQETIQEQIVPDFNNIENLNISLQDLENKKYNELINKRENNFEENFVQSETTNNNENNTIPEVQEQISNTVESQTQNNEMTYNEEPAIEQLQENTIPQETEQQTNIVENQEQNIETPNEVKNEEPIVEQSQEMTNIEQNTIEQNNIIPDTQEQQNAEQTNQINGFDQFTYNKPEPSYTGEIPEIFSNVEQNYNQINEPQQIENTKYEQDEQNISNDSVDDDIWKF